MTTRRLAGVFLVLAVLSAPLAARAAESAAAAKTAKKVNKKPPKVKKAAPAKAEAVKADKPAKADKPDKKAKVAKGKTPETGSSPDSKMVRKIRGSTLTVTADGEIKTISDDGKIIPFPSNAGAVKKAFSQVRRDQLGDAERSARAPKEDDRWWTVLFHLRSMDSRNDPEACFWRAIAFYRMGEISRARNTRQFCETEAALGDEDALSASLQPMAALPEMQQPGDPKPTPVANLSPYAGPGPTKIDK
jgi:hypothetical protein